MATNKKPTVFISYRRSDTNWAAAALISNLKSYLPGVTLFLDILSIKPGLDFETILTQTLEQVDVQLVLIGKSWLFVQDETGRRRIDTETDWVRKEITWGLERNILVIPILVDGATMPTKEALPDSLKSLARRQSHEIRFEDHEVGIEKILRILTDIFKASYGDLTKGIATPSPVEQLSATGTLEIFEKDSGKEELLQILAESQLDRGRFGLAKAIFELILKREFEKVQFGGFPDIDAWRAEYFIGKAKLLEGKFEEALSSFKHALPYIAQERDTSYPLHIRTQLAMSRAYLESGKMEQAKSILPKSWGMFFRDQSLTAIELWIAHLEQDVALKNQLIQKLDEETSKYPPTKEFEQSLEKLKQTITNVSSTPTMLWR